MVAVWRKKGQADLCFVIRKVCSGQRKAAHLSEFATLLRAARRSAGLTMAKVADATGAAGRRVDSATISRIEAGTRQPTLRQAEVLAEVLGFDLPEPEAQGGEDAEAVGARIRAARRAQDLTLVQLAARMRELGEPTAYSVLSRYEHGTIAPSVMKLRAIAAALGTTIDRLLSDDVHSSAEAEIVAAFRADGIPGLMLWCSNALRQAADK